MENDNEILPETVEETPTEPEVQEERKTFTPEELRGIKLRNFKKLAKELEIDLPKPKVELQTDKPKGFDRADKAYLRVEGVPVEDFDFVYKAHVLAGNTELEETLADEFVQTNLKSRKESRVAKSALPQSTRGGEGNSQQSVDYWLAKGVLPPKDLGEKLRRDYVNEKAKRLSGPRSNFYNS